MLRVDFFEVKVLQFQFPAIHFLQKQERIFTPFTPEFYDKGNKHYWYILLAIPLVPALMSVVIMIVHKPQEERFNNDIRHVIQPCQLADISMWKLLQRQEVRWPLITSLVLQLLQQLCAINAVFYFAFDPFQKISSVYTPSLIMATLLAAVLATIASIRLVDRLGRKTIIVFSMAIMIVDLFVLVICLQFRGDTFVNLSIACIVIFIACFAFGLGPIPFIYTAECFKQNERRSAVALCTFANWSSSTVLTIGYIFLIFLTDHYVFLVIMCFLLLGLVLFVYKVITIQ